MKIQNSESLLLVICILLIGCGTSHTAPAQSEDTIETAMFSYPDTAEFGVRHDVCPVKYYVRGDTIFTNERYHYLNLVYSYDCDSTMAYHKIIFFDRDQTPEDGWYELHISQDPPQRIEDTHISGIVLRGYRDKYHPEGNGLPNADAYIFNAAKEIAASSEKSELSPQLSKLLPYIK